MIRIHHCPRHRPRITALKERVGEAYLLAVAQLGAAMGADSALLAWGRAGARVGPVGESRRARWWQSR